MTYLAPRQGLFAIIVLISFFLQTMLLLVSSGQQLDLLKRQIGDQILTQLTEDVKQPLKNNDKVSLSVEAGRYINEKNVASLTIKGIDDSVILPLGQAKSLSGELITQPVMLDGEVIGSITLMMRETSNGEIIAAQWVYILGSFVLHLLLWLIYGYIARPTKAQLAALSHDIQEQLMVSRPNSNSRGRGASAALLNEQNQHDLHDGDGDDDGHEHEEDDKRDSALTSGLVDVHYTNDARGAESTKNTKDTSSDTYQNASRNHEASLDGEDNQLTVRPSRVHVTRSPNADNSSENSANNITDKSADNDTPYDNVEQGAHKGHEPDDIQQAMASLQDQQMPNNQASDKLASDKNDQTTKPTTRKTLDPNRSIDVAVVQIRFYDPSNLMGTLAPEQSKPYLALCTQLLQRTIAELLKQPLLHGIKVRNQPVFDNKGVDVEFTSSGIYSKVGLAATMLAKVYVMLNQVTYLKHRELQRFALEIYAGVSDESTANELQQLLRNRAEVNTVYALLPQAGIKQLNGHLQLGNLPNPTTVYERDCTTITGTSDAMVQRLVDVRNAVLLSGQK